MKSLVWFVAGLGAAAAVGQVARWRRERPWSANAQIDLNGCHREDLLVAGLDEELADKIIDNRPYRSKFDLLNRFIVSDAMYARLRSRVYVDAAAAHSTVQIAQA